MTEKINANYYSIIPASVRYDEDLTPAVKILYSEITALTNAKGYCWASNSYFANLYKVSTVTISRWVKQLVSNGYLKSEIIYKSGTKEIDKRVLTITDIMPINENANTYTQNCYDPINKNVNTPINKNVKENSININNTSINNKNIYKKDFINENFNDFYKLYPKKVNRKKAEQRFETLFKGLKQEKADKLQSEIMQGLNVYISYIKEKGIKPEFILHPTTWLNGERWADDYKVNKAVDDIPDFSEWQLPSFE